jgi:YD repeat-containing protein
MNMKPLLIILSLTLLPLFSYGQDKKEVIEKGIQVKRNYGLDLANSDKEATLEKEEFYNFRGDLVEVKTYSDNGKTLNDWTKYKYDSQGNLIEETELNSKGEQKERFEYKYENGLKTEKLFYDNKNRLTKKKIFKYELRK